MTADIDPYGKTKAHQDTELSGLVLVVSLLAILLALVLFFS